MQKLSRSTSTGNFNDQTLNYYPLTVTVKRKTNEGTHINKLTQTHIQYKRWKWKQANSEPEIELPFKGSKSTMAATTMSIKTTTTTTTAAKWRAEQSSRQAAGVWSSTTHASEWEVGLDEHLATDLTVSLYLSFCMSLCQAASLLSNISSACRSACLTLHPLNYLSATLSPSLHPFLIRPGVYLCARLPLCVQAAGIGEDGGGGVGRGGW